MTDRTGKRSKCQSCGRVLDDEYEQIECLRCEDNRYSAQEELNEEEENDCEDVK